VFAQRVTSLSSSDASYTLYALQADRASLPNAKTKEVNRVFSRLRGCFFHILHASSRRGSYFTRSGKVSKTLFLVRRKIMGTPKSPIGFLGKRKHNEAMSFFRVSEKTISGVRADEVAVNFSATPLL